MGTNSIMPPTVFNDRGAYSWGTDPVTPSCNYMGNIESFPSSNATNEQGGGFPSGFQSLGVSDGWTTNFQTCTCFNNRQNYSWLLSDFWSPADTFLGGLNIQFKIKFNALPSASSFCTFMEIGTSYVSTPSGLAFEAANVSGNGNLTIRYYYAANSRTTMWSGGASPAVTTGIWYSMYIYITEGTPLINLYGGPLPGGNFNNRLNNGVRNWRAVTPSTGRFTVGASHSSPTIGDPFNGCITDLTVWRQRNSLMPAGTGWFTDTTFI